MSIADPTITSLRDRLKIATRELHGVLDSDSLSATVMSPDVSPQGYQRFLERTYGFVAPLERQLAGEPLASEQSACGLTLSNRERLLRADFHALGLSDSQIDRLPLMSALPEMTRRGHALGMRYVIDGSTMGGLVIAQHVGKRLGITPTNGGSFLLPGGDPRGVVQSFHRFVAVLDGFPRSPLDEQDALDAAVATFQAIGKWFSLATPASA